MIHLLALTLFSLSCVQSGIAAEIAPVPPEFPQDSQVPTVKLPLPEIETLSNGLKVVWFVDDRLPVVDLALLIESGNRSDPKGKSGTSDLLSSVLDRGAGGLSAREIAKSIEGLGASRYSAADEDAFSIGMHGLAPDAPVLLEFLAKIALQPDLPPEEIARERVNLLERWNHIGDSADTLASIAFYRKLTAGTSYGRGGLASMNELKKVQREDLLAFHKKHFTPKNSILMVIGRVKREEFKKRIETLFGGWTGEIPRKEFQSYSDPDLKSVRGEVIVVDRPGLTQAQVRLGFRTLPIHSPHHYPLVVGNALLGEYFNSRLNSVIRDQLGLTYGIGSGFSYSKDLARFGVSSSTQTENVGRMIAKTLEILKNVKEGDISEEEIRLSKQYLIGGYPIGVSTLGAIATRWASGHLFDLGPQYLNEFVPKISAVTRPMVISAVDEAFDLRNLTIVIAGDAREIRKSLQKDLKRYPKVKVISINALK